MKNKIIFRIVFILTIVTGLSCAKNDNKWEDFQTFNSAYPVCGQYYVNWTLNGAPANDPTILSLYNSSKNDGIWIDDNKHFWQFKVKANISGTNFSVVKGYDEYWDDSTTIMNGSAVNGIIYFQVEFKSSPGDTFVCQGIRQTGFEE